MFFFHPEEVLDEPFLGLADLRLQPNKSIEKGETVKPLQSLIHLPE